MKEIMLPYILFVWLLFKFKVLQPTTKNYFITVSIGALLAMALFIGHRFYSPVDLTNSTTIKAPHAVLSPAIGQHIDTIYVDHNQHVSEGEILYTLKDDKVTAAITEVKSALNEIDRTIDAQVVQLLQAKRDLKRNQEMDEHVSVRQLEVAQDTVDIIKAEQKVLNAKREGLIAN